MLHLIAKIQVHIVASCLKSWYNTHKASIWIQQTLFSSYCYNVDEGES